MRDEWEAGAWKKKARQVGFALPETKLDGQRVARGRRGQSGTESRAKLSKFLLKRCVGRLCFGKNFPIADLGPVGKKAVRGNSARWKNRPSQRNDDGGQMRRKIARGPG